MSQVAPEVLYTFNDTQLKHLFGGANGSDGQSLKIGIASRNLEYVLSLLDEYLKSNDDILYIIMSTMIELEKIQVQPYTQSILTQYAKRWSREDIYNMFMQAYECVLKTRTISANTYDLSIYLLSLMQFSQVPSVEVLQ